MLCHAGSRIRERKTGTGGQDEEVEDIEGLQYVGDSD
jgi:hypothetical protein